MILYENNSITIETSSNPNRFLFADPENDWYKVIDITDTDDFIKFMDEVGETYTYDVHNDLYELFCKIFDEAN